MANLESKVSLQMNRLRFIKATAEESQEKTFLTMHLQMIRTKLELIEENWEKFNETHEKLCDIKSEVFLKLDYVTNGIYDQCLAFYAQAKVGLLFQREKLEKVNPPSGSQLVNVSTFTLSPATRSLPEITINKFSGDYPSWRPFQDLFTSIIGKNPELTNVEKMHYLKSSLIGEAAQLIANLSVSGESFVTAWDLLVSRYENKRLFFSAQLDRLCGTQVISSRSAKELNSLLNSTTESLNALTALGAPTAHWDLLLVHLIVKRLDPKTRETWEMKLGSSTEPPSYDQLRNFLTGQARALENLELNKPLTSSSPQGSTSTHTQQGRKSAASAHVASQSTAPRSTTMTCVLCGQAHFIVLCPDFRDKTSQQRRETVESLRLCYNCLGNHNAVNCRNPKRCQECNNKHHTMIHISPAQARPQSKSTGCTLPQSSSTLRSQQKTTQDTQQSSTAQSQPASHSGASSEGQSRPSSPLEFQPKNTSSSQ